MQILTRPIPGARPTGSLQLSNFAPGEIVMRAIHGAHPFGAR